jgi:hypothetical protein
VELVQKQPAFIKSACGKTKRQVQISIDPSESGELSGLLFRGALVNDWWRSFTVAGCEAWFIRPSTLLEGREVANSLFWMMVQLRCVPERRRILADFVDTLYGKDSPFDYRLFLDLVSGVTATDTIVSLTSRTGYCAREQSADAIRLLPAATSTRAVRKTVMIPR